MVCLFLCTHCRHRGVRSRCMSACLYCTFRCRLHSRMQACVKATNKNLSSALINKQALQIIADAAQQTKRESGTKEADNGSAVPCTAEICDTIPCEGVGYQQLWVYAGISMPSNDAHDQDRDSEKQWPASVSYKRKRSWHDDGAMIPPHAGASTNPVFKPNMLYKQSR